MENKETTAQLLFYTAWHMVPIHKLEEKRTTDINYRRNINIDSLLLALAKIKSQFWQTKSQPVLSS